MTTISQTSLLALDAARTDTGRQGPRDRAGAYAAAMKEAGITTPAATRADAEGRQARNAFHREAPMAETRPTPQRPGSLVDIRV
jgi:hypothetical protein